MWQVDGLPRLVGGFYQGVCGVVLVEDELPIVVDVDYFALAVGCGCCGCKE